jgi:hypothetical protein
MTNIQKLQAWVDEEKKNGLIDIKFFPSENVIRQVFGLSPVQEPDVDLEAAAGDVLALLSGSIESEDITNENL